MNLYYTGICQLINGDKELEGSGYFVKTEDGRILQSDSIPTNVQVVTFKDLEDALYEGCMHIINEFVSTNNNKDVYAFNLYADEHNSFYVYLNTETSFREYVDRNYSTYTEDKRLEIKYNQGDFTYQFFPSDMGISQELINGCMDIANSDVQYNEKVEHLLNSDLALIAYEKRIFNNGFYLAAFNALQRLGDSTSFDKLDKANRFIYYAATGHDYVDYSLLMRKTIESSLFYLCFPELKDKDEEFESIVNDVNKGSISAIIDFWEEALQAEFNEGSPYKYIKLEYQIFDKLRTFGDALAYECSQRLVTLIKENLADKQVRNKIEIYIKALEFVDLNEEILQRLFLIEQYVNNLDRNEFLKHYTIYIMKDLRNLIAKNTMKS